MQNLFRTTLQTDPTPLTIHRQNLPVNLVAAINLALNRNPTTRFPDCQVFAMAIRPFAGSRFQGEAAGSRRGLVEVGTKRLFQPRYWRPILLLSR